MGRAGPVQACAGTWTTLRGDLDYPARGPGLPCAGTCTTSTTYVSFQHDACTNPFDGMSGQLFGFTLGWRFGDEDAVALVLDQASSP